MYCQKPTIILRKDLHKILGSRQVSVYTDGNNTYPLGKFFITPKSVGATYENYKNWSILTADGELIPLFMAVPCGKCVLCADKKAKAWSTRATCEDQTATFPALFLTLTYEGSWLPLNGVEKSDLQNFIKRFRENYVRMFHSDRLDLRYFAVAEYGSKYGRPHYHLQFWNVPNDKDNQSKLTQMAYQCMCRSWSSEVTEEEYKAIPPELEFLKFKFDGKFYKLRGKVDMSCDEGNSAAYCMKYMFKDKIVPEGQNPTFYLSSRRGGGIGMRYLNEVIDSIREQEPAKTTILVRNHPHPYSLPRAFKDKLFPSLSMIIPSHIRNQLCRFDKICDYLIAYNKYDFTHELRESLRGYYGQCYDLITKSERMYRKYDPLINLNECLGDLRDILAICYNQCMEFEPDIKKIDYFLKLKDDRVRILQKLNFPDINVDDEAYKIRTRHTIRKLNEKF